MINKSHKFIKYSGILVSCAAFIIFFAPSLSLAQEWAELKGDHFIVYFAGDEDLAKNVLNKAEYYYSKIATDLGYPRYSEFWTWDKRTKIYIYPDRDSFIKASGQPSWSVGMADYLAKSITSYTNSEGFLDSLLPHEIAHLIFRDFVGFAGEVPLWLDEGVAQWEEAESTRKRIKELAKDLLNKDALIKLTYIMRIDTRLIKDDSRVYIRPTISTNGQQGIVFLSSQNMVNTFYIEAASLVGFMMEKYGSQRFSDFCRRLKEGKSMDEAISSTYAEFVRDLKELEQEWVKYISES